MDRVKPTYRAPNVLSNAGIGAPGTGTGPLGAAPGMDVMAGSTGAGMVGLEAIGSMPNEVNVACGG